MAERLYQYIEYVESGFWKEYGDPRVEYLPLMSNGPWKVVSICLVYLMFSTFIGPRMMKGRPPYSLRYPLMFHNVFLILLNTAGFTLALMKTNYGADAFACMPIDITDQSSKQYWLIGLGYTYFISKLIDFGDTIFFILRKKNTHVTILHVFHHFIMPIIAWAGVKFHASGNSSFVPIVNAFVHIVMYTYYLLSSFGPQMAPYLWWKKYITQLQLIQFLAILCHSLYSMLKPSCQWPKLLAALEFLQASIFFAMFANFYISAYLASCKRVKSVATTKRISAKAKSN